MGLVEKTEVMSPIITVVTKCRKLIRFWGLKRQKLDTEVGTAGLANTPRAGYERKFGLVRSYSSWTVEPREGPRRALVMEKPGARQSVGH